MDASASRCGLPRSKGWLPSPSLCLHLYLLYSGRTPQLSLGISVGQDLTRLPRKCYAILGELDIYFGLSFSHWSNHEPRRSSLCGQPGGGVMAECSCSSDPSNMVLKDSVVQELLQPQHWALGFSQWCLASG